MLIVKYSYLFLKITPGAWYQTRHKSCESCELVFGLDLFLFCGLMLQWDLLFWPFYTERNLFWQHLTEYIIAKKYIYCAALVTSDLRDVDFFYIYCQLLRHAIPSWNPTSTFSQLTLQISAHFLDRSTTYLNKKYCHP